jgi:hypothetical protein
MGWAGLRPVVEYRCCWRWLNGKLQSNDVKDLSKLKVSSQLRVGQLAHRSIMAQGSADKEKPSKESTLDGSQFNIMSVSFHLHVQRLQHSSFRSWFPLAQQITALGQPT